MNTFRSTMKIIHLLLYILPTILTGLTANTLDASVSTSNKINHETSHISEITQLSDTQNEYKLDSMPDLNCILFQDHGCDATCKTISYLYGTIAYGVCNPNLHCHCHRSDIHSTLDWLWNEKFLKTEKSDALFEDIRKNPDYFDTTLHVLKKFPRSPHDSLHDLEAALPDISDFRVLDIRKIPLYDHFNENNHDETREKIQQHVSQQIQRQLLEGHLTTDLPAYHVTLERFLADSANDNISRDHIANEIVKIDNDSLKQYIDTDRPLIPFDDTKNNPNHETIPQYVTIAVIDELVKYIDETKKFSNILTPATALSKYHTPTPHDFTSIDDHPEPFSLQWENDQVSVQLERVHTTRSNNYGEIALRFSWKKDAIEIELNTYTNTNIMQTWTFHNVNALLCRDENGTKNQYWNVGPTTYYYYEGKQDGTYVSLTTPDAEKTVKYYENEINSFCRENLRFYPIQDCIAYHKNPINFTSDEISTDSKETQSPRKYQPPRIDDFYIIAADETNALEMTWQGRRGTIHQQREDNGTWRLDWNIDDIVVNLIKYFDGRVEQFWYFGDAAIQVVRHPNGIIDQFWDIEGQKFQYDHHKRKIDHIEPDDLMKYQQEMKLWCEENRRFFRTEFCVIYESPSV